LKQVETQIRPLRVPDAVARDADVIPLVSGERAQGAE